MSGKSIVGIHADLAGVWYGTPFPSDADVDSVIAEATADGHVDPTEAEALRRYRRTTRLGAKQVEKLIIAEKSTIPGIGTVWLTPDDRMEITNAGLGKHKDATIDRMYRAPQAYDQLTARQKRDNDLQTVAALRGNQNAAKAPNATVVVKLASQTKSMDSDTANATLASMRADQRVRVVAWLRSRPQAYRTLDAQWRNDPEVVLAMLKQWPGESPSISDDFAGQAASLTNAERAALATHLSGARLRHGWGKVMFGGIYTRLAELETSEPARYQSIVDRANAAGIDQLHRFGTLENLERVLADHDASADDPRPVALFVVSTRDYNGAFQSTAHLLRDVPAGYRVKYVEAKDKEGLERAYAEQAASGKPADVVVRGGHGWPQGLEMGDDDVTTKDIVALGSKYPSAVAKDALLISYSCSAGDGKAGADNVVNADERAWPQASSVGSTVPTNVTGLIVENGKIKGAKFWKGKNGEDMTYQTP